MRIILFLFASCFFLPGCEFRQSGLEVRKNFAINFLEKAQNTEIADLPSLPSNSSKTLTKLRQYLNSPYRVSLIEDHLRVSSFEVNFQDFPSVKCFIDVAGEDSFKIVYLKVEP